MNINFEEMLATVTDHMKSVARTETIIGEPFKLGEFECVPVIKVGMGFGSGGGTGTDKEKGSGSGGGAGGGVGVQPLGFLVSRGSEISLLNVGESKGLKAIFEKVPDLMDRIMEMRERREKEKDKKK